MSDSSDLKGFLSHITDVANLPGISQSGLLSRNQAWSRQKPTDISLHSVQERRRGKSDPLYHLPLHDYALLYFRHKNPMLYRLQERRPRLAVLCVDAAVLKDEGVVFTDGNAASPRTMFFRELDDLRQLDWDCLTGGYWTDFEDGARKRCAEVLVPHQVPNRLIGQVVVSNQHAKAEAEACAPPWPVFVREGFFLF